MLSLGSARAAFLLYQNARAVTGAADHLSRYLVPLLREWSATDAPLARQLELLGARADSVCPALDFLLEWCSDKGSSLQNILFHARDTLHRIERFLASLGSGGATGALVAGTLKARIGGGSGVANLTEAEKEQLMKQIDGHLKELDWALSSLSLAISVINASAAAKPVLPAGATYLLQQQPANAAAAAPVADVPRYISPSCLLRASDRMRSMAGGSGDLVVVQGRFYRQTLRGRTFADSIRKAQEAPSSTSSHASIEPHKWSAPQWTVPMVPVAEIHSTSSGALADSDLLEEERRVSAQPHPLAINSAGGRMLVSSEGGSPHARWIEGGAVPEIRLSSAEPEADEFVDIAPSPLPAMVRAAAVPSPQLSPQPVLSGPPSPDPEAAGLSQWKQVFASAELKLVRNATRNLYELHIVNTAPSSDQLAHPSSSTLKYDLSATLAFRSTSSTQLGLAEDAAAKRGLSAAIDAVFAFEERIANALQARFAFMVHATSAITDGDASVGVAAAGAAAIAAAAAAPSAKSSLASGADTVSALDIAYLARLATYENLHAESNRGNAPIQQRRAVNLGCSNAPAMAHTRASDEELWLLLAGVHIVPPEMDASASRTASRAVSPAAAASAAAPAPSVVPIPPAAEPQQPAPCGSSSLLRPLPPYH